MSLPTPTAASEDRLDLDGVLVAPLTICRAGRWIHLLPPLRAPHGRDPGLRPRRRHLLLQDPPPRRPTPAPPRPLQQLPPPQRQEQLRPGGPHQDGRSGKGGRRPRRASEQEAGREHVIVGVKGAMDKPPGGESSQFVEETM
ncbi:hypothetical protein VPH35_051784 [Triticum aestivum]